MTFVADVISAQTLSAEPWRCLLPVSSLASRAHDTAVFSALATINGGEPARF